ncbi:thioredoxin family protein [Novipirellula caenicola]
MKHSRTVFAQRVSGSLLVCFLTAMVGCGVSRVEPTSTDTIENGLPVISGKQLDEYVRASKSPVLVEFGVDFNCPRCAQTKSDVVRLRESLQGNIDVIRVDFNANAQRVAQLGGTICPTYVLFDQGEPVITRSFPISIDLLEGEVLRLTEP